MSASTGQGQPLLPHHLTSLLEGSGLSEEVIRERGYRSVTSTADLSELGFTAAQARVPGLLIPLHGVHVDVRGYSYRPDKPRLRGIKPVKYEQPKGSHPILDIPRRCLSRLKDPAEPLYITEGTKKADALAMRGACALSLSGVWNWRGSNSEGGKAALADWDSVALNGRVVFVVFDSDVTTKKAVATALQRLRGMLELRGAKVRIVYLPDSADGAKQGVDDFFATGGQLADLEALSATSLRAELEHSKDTVASSRSATFTNGHKLTDLGNSERLIDLFGEDLRYSPALGWLCWDGRRWRRDEGGAERCAKQTARSVWHELSEAEDADKRRDLMLHAARSENAARIRATLELARSDVRVELDASVLDANPWMLNVENGTLDLRTGDLLVHCRADLNTRLSPIDYDPKAACPRFLSFLDRIMKGNAELIAFLQEAFGYSLTGLSREHVLFILWGSGRNGKSTLLEVIRRLLGDYALNVAAETLSRSQRNPGGPAEDLARLAGVRFVTASEIEDGAHLAESLVKRMTGGDRLTARRPFARESIEFNPYAKIFLATNHRPIVIGSDEAIWSRLRLVPFAAFIPEDERDSALPEKLLAEGSGILNWMLAGLARYVERGALLQPGAVRAATQGYREEMDNLKKFMRQRCLLVESASIRSSELYAGYVRWAKEEGEVVASQRKVSVRLVQDFGLTKDDRRDGNYFIGIRLLNSADDPRDGASVELVEHVEALSETSLIRRPSENVPGSASTSSTCSTDESERGPERMELVELVPRIDSLCPAPAGAARHSAVPEQPATLPGTRLPCRCSGCGYCTGPVKGAHARLDLRGLKSATGFCVPCEDQRPRSRHESNS